MQPPSGDWLACHAAHMHGPRCSCRALAAATGTEASTLDYRFCVNVLQKRWRMTCDHIPRAPRKIVTPNLPPHDARDPVHALLIANADTDDS